MDGARGMYGGEKRYMHGLGWETWGKETTWNTSAYEDNIKMNLKQVGWGLD